MDAAKWPQNFPEVGLVKQPMPMKEVVSNTCNTSTSTSSREMLERKARAQEQLNCPRCNSTNTKFCYYNNYSLTQPRYFCKTCRRYWTEGGSLRNVPVGGGSRKNKRSASSSSPSPSSNNKLPDLNPPNLQNPKIYKGQDLNLDFQVMRNETHDISHYIEGVSNAETNNITNMSPVSALDLLRTGISSRGLDSFIPTVPMLDSNTLFSSGFPLQDVKPGTLSFSMDHMHHGVVQDNNGTGNGRLFFPFGDQLKQLSSAPSTGVDQNKGQGTSTGYWNGMFG